MRPVCEAVEHVHAVGPCGIRLPAVVGRALPPSAGAGIGHDTHHIAVLSLQEGVVVEVRHHHGGEHAVFLGSLGNVVQSPGIDIASVTASACAEVAVLAVLIPRHEVHADIVDTHLVIMLEKAVDIFVGTRVRGHNPVEDILGVGVCHRVGAVVGQRSESVVGAFDHGAFRAVYPQGVVVDTHLQAALRGHGHEVLERHRAVVGHVARLVLGEHRHEAVGAHHVVAVGLEVARHPVENLFPLLSVDIHLVARHSGALQLIAVFIYAPVHRSLESVDIANVGELRELEFGRSAHLYLVAAAAESGANGESCQYICLEIHFCKYY